MQMVDDLGMSKRTQRLRGELGSFVHQYRRKKNPGIDPNDRRYSREIEQQVKQMDPRELDELLHGDDSNDQCALEYLAFGLASFGSTRPEDLEDLRIQLHSDAFAIGHRRIVPLAQVAVSGHWRRTRARCHKKLCPVTTAIAFGKPPKYVSVQLVGGHDWAVSNLLVWSVLRPRRSMGRVVMRLSRCCWRCRRRMRGWRRGSRG